MAQNVTQYCHVCKSQTTSGPPVMEDAWWLVDQEANLQFPRKLSRLIAQRPLDFQSKGELHSSVGRASHRHRGDHRFDSRWSPDFFQASSFLLLKLEIYCEDHSSLSLTLRNGHCFSVNYRCIVKLLLARTLLHFSSVCSEKKLDKNWSSSDSGRLSILLFFIPLAST